MSSQTHATTTLTEADVHLAGESLRRLTPLLESGKPELRLHIRTDERPDEEIALPSPALGLLKDILAEMARGHAVTLLPVRDELTTQQAADLLNVSRPYFIGLLESGKISFRLVGQHRRVRLDDVMAYKREDDAARRRIADELTAEAQALGLGY
jgi:excisionase family DNA binding protein